MSGVKPVEIRSDGLLLRPWQPGDAEAVHRACQDPELHRWLGGLPWPYRRADAAAFVGELAPRWLAEGRALHLGVFDRDGLAGSIALHDIDAGRRTAEIGYWSAPWARGGRIAERAGRALLSWAFTDADTSSGRSSDSPTNDGPDNDSPGNGGPGGGPDGGTDGGTGGGTGGGLGLARVDWRASIGNHSSRLTALRLGFHMIGERPGTAPAAPPAGAGTEAGQAEPDRWLAALLPGDLTPAGHDVPEAVRRSARTFGGAHPTLSAGALTLRPPARRDLPGVLAARRDPETARWFGVPQPYTEEQALTHIERNVPRRWARGAEAVFAIADPGDGYVGSVDLRIAPEDPAVGEVGFLIVPGARGRGYATAAVRAVCGWGFETLGLARIQWRAETGNHASRRVAERAGFHMEGLQRQALRIDGERRDCWVGALVRGEPA
jgi:RimJ/RimL family protein N-acetyltransferase